LYTTDEKNVEKNIYLKYKDINIVKFRVVFLMDRLIRTGDSICNTAK